MHFRRSTDTTKSIPDSVAPEHATHTDRLQELAETYRGKSVAILTKSCELVNGVEPGAYIDVATQLHTAMEANEKLNHHVAIVSFEE